MHAYSESYLNDASAHFAEMTDYAVNDLRIDGDTFLQMFIVSGIAEQFERGNRKYIAGRSGIELADEIILKCNYTASDISSDSREVFSSAKTPEYWAGWALAQYQWHTAKSFSSILQNLPFSDIVLMYPTFHEADITKFFDTANTIIRQKNPHTNLKRIRTAAGISQTKLAKEAEVSLRSIQMYEQRNKDINKAQAITLSKIARVLSCTVEDLLESENT